VPGATSNFSPVLTALQVLPLYFQQLQTKNQKISDGQIVSVSPETIDFHTHCPPLHATNK